MNKDSKIFVAGHRGLVGSAILKNLKAKGYTNFVLRTHAELDLTDQQAVLGKYLYLSGKCSATDAGGLLAHFATRIYE